MVVWYSVCHGINTYTCMQVHGPQPLKSLMNRYSLLACLQDYCLRLLVGQNPTAIIIIIVIIIIISAVVYRICDTGDACRYVVRYVQATHHCSQNGTCRCPVDPVGACRTPKGARRQIQRDPVLES